MAEEVPVDAYMADEDTADCFEACAHKEQPYECFRKCIDG